MTVQLVYILGSGHCGSTLLNLLLNGHSQILGLSEIFIIKDFTKLVWEKVLRSPFWRDVNQCYEECYGSSLFEVDFSDSSWREILAWNRTRLTQWAEPNRNLFTCISEKSGQPILVDASKVPKRLYLLQKSKVCNIKVIHLVRDGRAVVNSYLRKYENFNTGINRWMKTNLAAFALRSQFKNEDWLQLKYEEIAIDPTATLERICNFTGVAYEPKMLNYRSHLYVGMGGNSMRSRRDENIALDERWKQELSGDYLVKFNFIGGWLNKFYGY